MNRLRTWLNLYREELVNKVQWPKAESLQGDTITVLVASLILALVIALLDFAFSNGMGLVYGLFE
ncbi:MAG: preprotein translocase subunit SecE [Bacteroidia bacterium]|nr:preprotein translocase subunit SecE [Bacteroidia bacterium]